MPLSECVQSYQELFIYLVVVYLAASSIAQTNMQYGITWFNDSGLSLKLFMDGREGRGPYAYA